MGKRELIALLRLSYLCPVVVVWLFLEVPWVCLQVVIVVFPDHTHLLFLFRNSMAAQCVCVCCVMFTYTNTTVVANAYLKNSYLLQ